MFIHTGSTYSIALNFVRDEVFMNMVFVPYRRKIRLNPGIEMDFTLSKNFKEY